MVEFAYKIRCGKIVVNGCRRRCAEGHESRRDEGSFNGFHVGSRVVPGALFMEYCRVNNTQTKLSAKVAEYTDHNFVAQSITRKDERKEGPCL